MSNDTVDVHDAEAAAKLYELIERAWGSMAAMMQAERQARRFMGLPPL